MSYPDPKSVRSIQKCEHCHYWTDGQKAFCSECGEILDIEFRKERWRLSQQWQELGGLMNYVRFKKARSNPFFWVLEKFVQTGQMIIAVLVLIVTIILFLLPG